MVDSKQEEAGSTGTAVDKLGRGEALRMTPPVAGSPQLPWKPCQRRHHYHATVLKGTRCATPNMLPWHRGYFQLKMLEKQQVQVGPPGPPFFLKAGREPPV